MTKSKNAQTIELLQETIEEKLIKIFDDAIGVEDTIWYTQHETLFDAILTMIEKEIELNLH